MLSRNEVARDRPLAAVALIGSWFSSVAWAWWSGQC